MTDDLTAIHRKVYELHKLKLKMKALKEKETEIKDALAVFIRQEKENDPEHIGRIESTYGTITMSYRKKYYYSEEVEAIEEELKAQKKLEEKTALPRDKWLAKGRPDVSIYDETESLSVRAAKKDK